MGACVCSRVQVQHGPQAHLALALGCGRCGGAGSGAQGSAAPRAAPARLRHHPVAGAGPPQRWAHAVGRQRALLLPWATLGRGQLQHAAWLGTPRGTARCGCPQRRPPSEGSGQRRAWGCARALAGRSRRPKALAAPCRPPQHPLCLQQEPQAEARMRNGAAAGVSRRRCTHGSFRARATVVLGDGEPGCRQGSGRRGAGAPLLTGSTCG